MSILMQRIVKVSLPPLIPAAPYRARMRLRLTDNVVNQVDGKVRTEQGYPAGFMDVVSFDKSDEFFRLL